MRAARPILLAILCWLAPACGEDDAPTRVSGQATPAPPAGGPAGGAGAGAGSGKQLVPQTSIEDRVVCLVESNAKKKCDPKSPKCGQQGEYCITNSEGSFCGPCKERDTIRRTFRPRDFVATIETRDPFQSFIVAQPGLGAASDDKVPLDPAKNCTREDQMVAQNYSYQDLKLVGIVTQGTQRKVLMLDSTNLGHIIKRGDCVGKEKAVVKEIGKEFITFEVQQEVGGTPGQRREPEQRSVQLYPKQLPVSSLPSEQQSRGTAAAPVIAPPPVPPPGPGAGPGTGPGGGAPGARPGTRIQVVPPQPQAPAVPPPAPTTLSP
jgi:Tfp pilus assembly protein PilP